MCNEIFFLLVTVDIPQIQEQLKLLTQQHEAHSQELDKQQSLAQQQYRDVLHQYKKQVVVSLCFAFFRVPGASLAVFKVLRTLGQKIAEFHLSF